ncbi:glycoside hydrolase family 27 protein [Novosphingobium sp. 2638]|uniref:Alpha-galactosidase n=2 Tax=Novosphingobium beihaiensis TaxID=2930389 RepID=A0ABT0BRK1_9SPHN|nr:glycoside hydrolase family 27 protein [Novosphingobium beihaiensis]
MSRQGALKSVMSALLVWLSVSSGAAMAGQPNAAPALAATPPMGWNSWNHYGCQIDEELIRRTADALAAKGLRDAGYVYVNIDDCWQGERDANGNIQPDPKRFPSGMKALGDYLHARGFKFGIYSDTGEKTCAGRPGSQGHEFQDAAQYARWGVDYVKYDWCNTGKDEWQRNSREGYRTMQRAIAASGRAMILSICEWGETKPWLWAAKVGQLWRTTGDITNCWDCVLGHGDWHSNGIMRIVDINEPLRAYAGPGHWNDPDMMEVGNMATLAEDRSHFALWAMMAAPLIMGTHVDTMKPEVAAILTNRRVIAVDQDARGVQGLRWFDNGATQVWAKPLAGGDWAVALVNRSDRPAKTGIDWASTPLEDTLNGLFVDFAEQTYGLTDLWTGKSTGTTETPLSVTLAPHDTAIYRLSPRR